MKAIATKVRMWAEPRGMHHLNKLPTIQTREEFLGLPWERQVNGYFHFLAATAYIIPIAICALAGAPPSEP